MNTFFDAQNHATGGGVRLIQLSEQELGSVSGGITSYEAGGILVGFAASVATGAMMGAIAGPGGVMAGALLGAARAAVATGIGALAYGAYASTGSGRGRGGKTNDA